jgi:hypothetical protein
MRLPSARLVPLALACAVLAAALALAALARGQGSPTPGGTVPSTLALSLSEPSPFKRHGDLYTSAIRAEVTATDVPTRLSLADGEVTQGPRLGHLVRGSRVLSPALQAAAGGGSYRSLEAPVPPPLKSWSEPLADTPAKIRLRQSAPTHNLHGYRKLLLVTLTAAGP